MNPGVEIDRLHLPPMRRQYPSEHLNRQLVGGGSRLGQVIDVGGIGDTDSAQDGTFKDLLFARHVGSDVGELRSSGRCGGIVTQLVSGWLMNISAMASRHVVSAGCWFVDLVHVHEGVAEHLARGLAVERQAGFAAPAGVLVDHALRGCARFRSGSP